MSSLQCFKHKYPGICALRKLGHRAPKPIPKNYWAIVRNGYYYGVRPQIFLFFADRKLIEAPVALLLDDAEEERVTRGLNLFAFSQAAEIITPRHLIP